MNRTRRLIPLIVLLALLGGAPAATAQERPPECGQRSSPLAPRAQQTAAGSRQALAGQAQVASPAGVEMFWRLTGNAGTDPNRNFVGTTDRQPLVLGVSRLPVLRLDPAPEESGPRSSPSIIAGFVGAFGNPGSGNAALPFLGVA